MTDGKYLSNFNKTGRHSQLNSDYEKKMHENYSKRKKGKRKRKKESSGVLHDEAFFFSLVCYKFFSDICAKGNVYVFNQL